MRIFASAVQKAKSVLALVICGLAAALAVQSGYLSYPDATIKPGELDLSGAWKIRFADDPRYADPAHSDEDWCMTGVPQGQASLKAAGVAFRARSGCPAEAYPRERMRDSTYWYRKTIEIPAGSKWKKPSLFLGNIKQEGEIHWDGRLVARERLESAPISVLLSPEETRPGRHLLAVRVTSLGDAYPGIFHAMPRKAALGEYAESAKAFALFRLNDHLEPFGAFVIQFLALFLVTYLSLRSGSRLLWLSIYFGAAAALSCSLPLHGEFKRLVRDISYIGMSIGMLGHSFSLFKIDPARRSLAHWILGWFLVLCLGLKTGAHLSGHSSWAGFEPLDRVVLIGGILATLGLLALGLRSRKQALSWATLFALHLVYAYSHLFGARSGHFIHISLVTASLTLLVVLLAIEEHIQQQRHLGFFGRFVRRGLKELLSENEKRALSGEKIFRGRRVVILKLDIIGHTDKTYGMPYGMKRLFQDSWFTTIDEVVAGKTFLDKGLGDGSFYYFEDRPDEKTAAQALEFGITIRDRAVASFDRKFRESLDVLRKKSPELDVACRRYLESYQARTGLDFFEKPTEVRFVLSSGFVDEGLWGMLSQGHYDVEGDLVTLTARLEKKASTREAVITPECERKLREELADFDRRFQVRWSEEELKGIGPQRYGLLMDKSLSERKAS